MPEFEHLTAGETTARAFIRIPEGARSGVVVLHAWWGLNGDVIAYADRLADAGHAVIAPDMFRGEVATEVADADRLSSESDDGVADTITLAAANAFAQRLAPGAPLATLGFSFGAAYALWAPSKLPSLVATVVYYGTMTGPSLAKSTAPLLGHFAETDEFEPAENVKALEDGFREAGREVEIHTYPGTGHWFAEPSRDAYRPVAAELAFERTLAFLNEQLTTAPG
jgi:carboxymethylenebutenolidase